MEPSSTPESSPLRQITVTSRARDIVSIGTNERSTMNPKLFGGYDVGISGTTGDLGTALAWLRPAALLQSSPGK